MGYRSWIELEDGRKFELVGHYPRFAVVDENGAEVGVVYRRCQQMAERWFPVADGEHVEMPNARAAILWLLQGGQDGSHGDVDEAQGQLPERCPDAAVVVASAAQ